MRRPLLCLAAVAVVVSSALFAQTSTPVTPSTPLAISGSASSARYCVSGYAAGVHSLGYLDANTAYRITFESDIPLAAAIARVNFIDQRVTAGYGTPELNLVSASPGTVALLVSTNGETGCYRYKAQIVPGASSTTSSLPQPLASPRSSMPAGTLALAGDASSGQYCVAGTWTGKVHGLGWVGQGDQITVTFESNFNPIAGLTITDPVAQRTVSYADDNSGGNQDPRISVVASQSGTAVLFVGGVNGSAGCYRYRVDVTPAATTLAQFDGSWTGTFTGARDGAVRFTVRNGAITATAPGDGTGTLRLSSAAGAVTSEVPVNRPRLDIPDIPARGEFTTRAATGTCTWSGPYLPGGARQGASSGLWSCSDGSAGQYTATKAATAAPVPSPTPTPAPAPAPAPGGRDGRYRAIASTHTCSAGSSSSEPCNWAPNTGGCNPYDFTFTVTAGAVRDACGFLTAANLGANGQYSGFYTGSGSTRMPVSGTFTSSTFQITGGDTHRGNTYRLVLDVTKQP